MFYVESFAYLSDNYPISWLIKELTEFFNALDSSGHQKKTRYIVFGGMNSVDFSYSDFLFKMTDWLKINIAYIDVNARW